MGGHKALNRTTTSRFDAFSMVIYPSLVHDKFHLIDVKPSTNRISFMSIVTAIIEHNTIILLYFKKHLKLI